MASKLCDSCKSATATLFCRADSAFLCLGCDSKIHAANKLASRHARVWVCEVCEQAPAHVTCKADAAALCVSCDRDIHSANPLARRHERLPVVPFYDSSNSDSNSNSISAVKPSTAINFLDDRYFSDVEEGDVDVDVDVSREEAEAASWLLPNPNPKVSESTDLNSGKFEFPEMDPYLDLDYGHVDTKLEAHEQNSSGTDGVVPDRNQGVLHLSTADDRCFGFDFVPGPKSFDFGYNHPQSMSHSVSSSSIDVGVVPDGSAMTEISNSYTKPATESTIPTLPISPADREARVMRYREKRKNRKFEKTIRYASRKAYAETRPRIKGRFAKRTTDTELEGDRVNGYGVVPSF